jgi:hypothetical protein
MKQIAGWIALPFIMVAMVLVPIMGGHLCPEEVIPLLGGTAAAPWVIRWMKDRYRSHCCKSEHK